MTTLDNVSITYTIVLHVVTLALNVQNNTKQMTLHNMECRNLHPELGVEIVNFKLFVCFSALVNTRIDVFDNRIDYVCICNNCWWVDPFLVVVHSFCSIVPQIIFFIGIVPYFVVVFPT